MATALDHIETLVSKAGELVETKAEIWKLKAAGKIAETGSSLITVLAIAFLGIAVFLMLSIGAAYWIGTMMGNTAMGFLIIAGFYLFIGLVIWIFRKQLIKRPLGNLLANKLTD